MNCELNKVSVVILNYNGQKLMQQYLPTVIANSGGAEIVVADNGSIDGSVEWLQAEYPDLRLIAFDKNYGFAEGYNQALKLVDNEYYVFSNIGYGKSLDLPVYDGVISFSLMIISCVLLFAVVFKGALFKCLKRKR